MIQEIFPREYRVQYGDYVPEAGDTVFLFEGDTICCRLIDGDAAFPCIKDLSNTCGAEFHYLFSIDKERFFVPDAHFSCRDMAPEGYEWKTNVFFRTTGPQYLAFAAVLAQSLYLWYDSNKYCGRCGAQMEHSKTERACVCKECGITVYPKLSPAVIVAVTDGENLLVTRYKDRPYLSYSLVAGFAEIGESLEDTVRREVFEETGVHVKNIQYYKSQPWGFTSTLLSGFFCELDGDPAIKVDENELAEALWLTRETIPPAAVTISLTSEMMERFRTGAT
ncbi:MAG: NAD(+) diphosphatase [Oscillospiraceae bacterium]|nr:NAD(+) diphosphatase [Oscillospiraceae bacterium]